MKRHSTTLADFRPKDLQSDVLPSRAGSLDLVGGALALDFTNTSSGRGTPRHIEHIRDFDTLMQWVEHARVVTIPDCARVRASVARKTSAVAVIMKRALETREMIWQLGTVLAQSRNVPADLRAALATAHAVNLAHAEIKDRDGTFIWSWDVQRNVQAAILGPITLSALTLLMDMDLSRTKRCEGTACGWLFFDATKNKSRRWCEMRVCGNRFKVRAARQRKRTKTKAC